MSRSLSVTILDFFLFFPEGSNLFDLLFLKKIIVDGFFFLKKTRAVSNIFFDRTKTGTELYHQTNCRYDEISVW